MKKYTLLLIIMLCLFFSGNAIAFDYYGATGGSSGSGDIAGPSSAVDNSVPTYDTTTGKFYVS